MSLDVSRLGIFCTTYHSYYKWHTFHNRKFLKHYKHRENGETISLHFHKAAVKSCSLKLIADQVSCIIITGQRFVSRRISSRTARFTLFLCSVSTPRKIFTATTGTHSVELIHCSSFCIPQNEVAFWQCLGLLLFMQQTKRIHPICLWCS